MQQVVLITGASRRVGLHMAKRFHQDGYRVLAQYRTKTEGVEELHALGIMTVQANFDSKEHIFAFIKDCKHYCESIRAIIHNASSFSPTEVDLEAAAEQYQQFFMVHMMAPYLINEALRDRLKGDNSDPADIVNITDINVENPTHRFDIYGTTKAGLQNMTLALAKKYAPKIKVNAIAPGPVLFTESHSDEVKQEMMSETPLGREGGAEPVYLAVKSLLTNNFLTGITIPVDGGRRLAKR